MGTLVDRGYLAEHPRRPNTYVLGVRAFKLGSSYERSLDLVREGTRVASDVVAGCNETVQMTILDRTDVVFIAKVDSTAPVRLVSDVGRRLPAHCTAGGKALLAALDDGALTARYPADGRLPTLTPSSIESPDRLRTQLAQVHSQGWAFEYCESNDDAFCVAAPVHDRTGAAVAAMSISVPSVRWSAEREELLAAQVVTSARDVSTALGHVPR
ncbi:IclR family transcriptional regulator [Blastococcus deserti]|uniref:IclR family transcriptional regulator n=1 Tax=Blastococcus deserti TaxID=2259033 RepID=A0ABW4X7Q8_9ACTN